MEETKTPWHGGPIGPSGHLKVSLNESIRQEMQHIVECYNSLEFAYKKGIETFNPGV
jgi:hypothetical protein